jgi:signal transduction histidine kinase
MNLFNIMGLVSTVALSLPIIFLLTSRLAWYRSFPALLFYYTIVLSYNIALLGYIDTSRNYKYYHGIICNFLDTPLILCFLLYFSKTVFFRKKLQLVIFGFIAFEIIVISLYGFNANATTIVLAPGIILTLVISLLFFIHQVKIAVVHHKAIGKAIMVSSLLFAYVGYSFVYTVYYLIKPVYKDDAHIVYFLINIVSCIAMAVGIYFEKNRVKQLSELQTTREELKAIYQEEREGKKMTAPREAVILNFDKKQWS